MRTNNEQIELLNHLLSVAKEKREVGETDWLEFKTNISESHSSITYERVGCYLSGIANSACVKDRSTGYLVLGVEDKTWDVVGTNLQMASAKVNNQDFELWLRKNLNPMISFEIEEFEFEESHIVIFIIPAASVEPVSFKGEQYIRIGSNLTKIKDFPAYIQKIYNSQSDWSAQFVPDATIYDLDKVAIDKARELYADKHPRLIEEMKEWDDITFLNKAKITRQGRITNTAIILLGKPESEVFISPSIAKIRWILKDGSGMERDYTILSCPFILSMEEIYSKIRNLTYRYLNPYFQTLFPKELNTYEPYVIREALYNCVAHQSYRDGGMINVVEFDDRLVFSNRGGFIPINVKNVLKYDAPEETYRNPFLVYAMMELKMVDTIGSGIRRMFKCQRDRLFPMPDYEISENRVQVTITGKVVDEKFAYLLSQQKDLSFEEIEMLNRVILRKTITDGEIEYLRKKKLIEGRKGNLIISKAVADVAGKKASYTKAKGLTQQYYLDLIITALIQHGELDRAFFEELLFDKLPDGLSTIQRYNKVSNLLTQLREMDLIEKDGIGKHSKWKVKAK